MAGAESENEKCDMIGWSDTMAELKGSVVLIEGRGGYLCLGTFRRGCSEGVRSVKSASAISESGKGNQVRRVFLSSVQHAIVNVNNRLRQSVPVNTESLEMPGP